MTLGGGRHGGPVSVLASGFASDTREIGRVAARRLPAGWASFYPRVPSAALPDRSPRRAGPQPRDVLRLDLLDGSPRTAGPQPRDVLRLDLLDGSPRTAGPQPRDVLRLALQEL